MAKIGVILGSIREGRAGEPVAQWVAAQAQGREHEYELVDLKDYPLPLLESATVPGQANKKYDNAQVQAWGDKIDTFDAYVFVSAVYNNNVPGPFKNAFDSLGGEWVKKPIAFVAYGFGGEQSAVDGWRKSVSGMLAMPYGDKATLVSIKDYFGEEGFASTEELDADLDATLAELEGLLS